MENRVDTDRWNSWKGHLFVEGGGQCGLQKVNLKAVESRPGENVLLRSSFRDELEHVRGCGRTVCFPPKKPWLSQPFPCFSIMIHASLNALVCMNQPLLFAT